MNQTKFIGVGVCLSLLVATATQAVAGPPGATCATWEYGGFVKGSRVFPMGKAIVRSAASPTAPILSEVVLDPDALGASDITVVERLEQTYRDATGYRDSWYKVSFADTDAGPKRDGFIWGGALAKAAVSADLDGDNKKELILVGVGGKPGGSQSEYKRVVTVRVMNGNGGEPSAIAFAPIEVQESDSFGYSLAAQAMAGGKGLTGKPGFVRVQFRYGACDYPNGDAYLVYSKQRLRYGLTAVSVANEIGGVSSDVIFPSDKKGKKNRVLVRSVYTEANNDTGKIVRQSTETKTYAWDGAALTPVRR